MHGALWKGASRALLVDGHHLFHRCLHMQESNPLLGPDGAPTGALFGVVRALRAFRRDIPADVGIVVYDDGGSSFRSTLYPAYKANRTALEEPTKKQLQQSKYWARALGWTVYQSQGVEADDTLAFLTKQRGHREAVMITGDKDLAQLVVDEPPAVLIWRPDFKGRYYKLDGAGVRAKWNLAPRQVADMLALMGDSSDNIAGVPGIGPKTASALLNEHDNLDALLRLAERGDIPGAAGRRLAEHADAARLYRKLTDLEQGIAPPGWTSMDACRFREPDWTQLLEWARQLSFSSMLEEFWGHVQKTANVAGL